MSTTEFVILTSRAWALPILSQMRKGIAGRQALLLLVTGASRGAFVQSLNHLISMGYLERNPGHGHPLRPEFRLTKQGVEVATLAENILAVAKGEGQDLLRRSWTLPVPASLYKPSVFGEVKGKLPTISDRALSQSLKSLEDQMWLTRRIEQVSRPPRSMYSSTNTGWAISEALTDAISFAQHR